MRATKLTVHNILGIENLEVQGLGKVTLIEGDNATGKTSVLEAIKFALKGGHDATLLRAGADRGEVVLVLDDGKTIEHAVTADGSPPTKVTDPAFGRVSKPAAFLDKLRNLTSVNPVSFLLASDREQTEMLLKTMPLKLDVEALRAAAGVPLADGELAGEPLEVIERVRRKVYDLRTGSNRVAGDKRRAAGELEKTLPPEAEGPVNLEELYAKERDLADQIQRRQKSHAATAEAAKQRLRDEEHQAIVAVRKQFSDRLDALVEELDTASKRHEAPMLAQQRELAGEIGRAIEANEQAFRAAYGRELLAKTKAEAAKAEGEAEWLSTALGSVDDLKGKLLENLPIKGLEIIDGRIHLNGVPLSRINTADRMAFALKMAVLGAGELGIVCMDDFEHLGQEMFTAFMNAAMKTKVQFFVTRVTPGPLRIRSGDEPWPDPTQEKFRARVADHTERLQAEPPPEEPASGEDGMSADERE